MDSADPRSRERGDESALAARAALLYKRRVDSIALSENIDATGTRPPWLRPELIAPWWEIVLVLAGIIGISSGTSTWSAWHGSSSHYVTDLVTDGRMVHTITMEAPLLGLLFVYLHRRGWRWADFCIAPGWRSSAEGLLLLPGMALANSVVVLTAFLLLFLLQTEYASFLSFLTASNPHLAFHSVHVSWFSIVPALVLNGFYEEITCMGYAFNQFAAKRGPAFALALTVLLRMSCHTYQGFVHALGVGAAFTVSGLVYWHTRNLWPLIFAHILADSASFAAIKVLLG